MNNKTTKTILGCILATLATVAFMLPAAAQSDDMYGTFATTKNGCAAGAKTQIVFKKKTATGPSIITSAKFECALAGLKPAGSGMMSSDAICVVDTGNGDEPVEDTVAFDFGNYKDRFEVSIPKMNDWIKMYRCK